MKPYDKEIVQHDALTVNANRINITLRFSSEAQYGTAERVIQMLIESYLDRNYTAKTSE